jgi:hypothetical protein
VGETSSGINRETTKLGLNPGKERAYNIISVAKHNI